MPKKLSQIFAYLGIYLGCDLHVTLEYFPNSTSDDYIRNILRTAPLGKKVTIHAIRKGSWQDKNFGYMVELPDEIKPLFKNKLHNIPHITVETRGDAKPVDTWKAFTGDGKSQNCDKYFEGEITMFRRNGSHFSTYKG